MLTSFVRIIFKKDKPEDGGFHDTVDSDPSAFYVEAGTDGRNPYLEPDKDGVSDEEEEEDEALDNGEEGVGGDYESFLDMSSIEKVLDEKSESEEDDEKVLIDSQERTSRKSY